MSAHDTGRAPVVVAKGSGNSHHVVFARGWFQRQELLGTVHAHNFGLLRIGAGRIEWGAALLPFSRAVGRLSSTGGRVMFIVEI